MMNFSKVFTVAEPGTEDGVCVLEDQDSLRCLKKECSIDKAFNVPSVLWEGDVVNV